MKKKALAAVMCALIALTAAICFAGCGKKEISYAGRWELTRSVVNGQEIDASEYGDSGLYFVFKEDGTAVINSAGQEYPGSWKPIENGVHLTDNEGMEFDLRPGENEDELCFDLSTYATFYMKKK